MTVSEEKCLNSDGFGVGCGRVVVGGGGYAN